MRWLGTTAHTCFETVMQMHRWTRRSAERFFARRFLALSSGISEFKIRDLTISTSIYLTITQCINGGLAIFKEGLSGRRNPITSGVSGKR